MLDLDAEEAAFWDRPPEAVHADLQSPLHWPLAELEKPDVRARLTSRQRAALHREFAATAGSPEKGQRRKAWVSQARTVLETLPPDEQALFRRFSLRVILECVPNVSVAEKEHLDLAVMLTLHAEGPAALVHPLIQKHLSWLWTRMFSAARVAEQKLAKDRWERILTAPLPDLRRVKERKPTVDRDAARAAVAEARTRVARLRQMKRIEQLFGR